MEVQLE
jgi:hypothetical protein